MIMETPVVVIDPTDIGLMVGWSFDHSNHFPFLDNLDTSKSLVH